MGSRFLNRKYTCPTDIPSISITTLANNIHLVYTCWEGANVIMKVNV
jgi:hypothetical protein